MLEVTGLHLWRGHRHLLDGIGFSLRAGQVLQLLWPNGTGKTSLLRCLVGFVHAEAGDVRWDGEPVGSDPVAFHRALAYLGHQPALKADLTALENLRHSLGLRRSVEDAQVRGALQAVGLAQLDDAQPVRSLSAGQQKRVALARLSLWDARLWLLDEPATNLDAAGQQVLRDILTRHAQGGGAALIATHQPLELPGVEVRRWLAAEQAA